MFFVADLECDLMSYCIKHKGRWWANHWFRNRKVNELYSKLRGLGIGTVIAIVGNGGPNYQKHIDFYENVLKPATE